MQRWPGKGQHDPLLRPHVLPTSVFALFSLIILRFARGAK